MHGNGSVPDFEGVSSYDQGRRYRVRKNNAIVYDAYFIIPITILELLVEVQGPCAVLRVFVAVRIPVD
jgi:hypothetical protein